MCPGTRCRASRTGSSRAWPSGRTGPWTGLYPVLFIDAIHVKIRDGAVANRPIYAAVGVTTDGERDILGLWAGTVGRLASW